MSDPDDYVMLMSSLPSPEGLFLSKQPPLSRLKLDQRLLALKPEDAKTLRLVEDVLQWHRLPMSITEEGVLARVRKALDEIGNEVLQQIIHDRLELRSCVAALRRRHRGEAPPASGTRWSFGRWQQHMARNWTEAAFKLDRVFPWLREADRLMKQADVMALERLLLQQAWRKLVRLSGEHEFDFEAVVIYVLKWNIIDRWGRYNGEAAVRRFDEMTEAGLGRHANLAVEGEL